MTKADELIKAATAYSHAMANGHSVVVSIPDWLSCDGVVRFCDSLNRIRAKSGKNRGHVFLQGIIGNEIVASYMTTYPPEVGSIKVPI